MSADPTGQRAPGASATVMIVLFLCVGSLALVLRLSDGGVLSASEIDLSHPSWGPSALAASSSRLATCDLCAATGGYCAVRARPKVLRMARRECKHTRSMDV